ncbi:hypothetical protein LA303_06120 [Candidatus Sulfidibacterium hydrothermale]|uniref:hypothetical protein n=1 Tax=Candidatus Sulfidibacterium hydrothermale TaxID=2875962 RepID=UPI001F0B1DA0|nr:hypothetical protein [Candidatus Sulfidibacterium hydrothermale]UBM63539.1 hypothetical protein LA303_06120 [Candidatus Sulfidibacterium hydrothermale]
MEYFKKVVLIAVIAVLFVLGACSTKSTDPYYKISDEFKQYCLYNENSYWIYMNDTTGTEDTLKVSDVQDYIAFHSPDNVAGPYSFDVVDMDFDTTENLPMVKGSITAGNPTTGDDGTMRDMYWLFFKDGNYLLAFAPGYPMGVEQLLGDNPGFYTNIEKLDNYSVKGFTYNDVYHTQVLKTEGTSDTVNYQFYFAKNYGLIKWTRSVNGETSSYSLIGSSLIQN